jgi:hypothetical protein
MKIYQLRLRVAREVTFNSTPFHERSCVEQYFSESEGCGFESRFRTLFISMFALFAFEISCKKEVTF